MGTEGARREGRNMNSSEDLEHKSRSLAAGNEKHQWNKQQEPVAHAKMIIAGGRRRANIIGEKSAKSRQEICMLKDLEVPLRLVALAANIYIFTSNWNDQTKSCAKGASRSQPSGKKNWDR